MPLTDEEIRKLNPAVNRMPIPRLEEYVRRGRIDENDLNRLTLISSERKAHLLSIIHEPTVDPEEQKEWAAIMEHLGHPGDELEMLLNGYVSHWELKMPIGNHVEEAKGNLRRLLKAREDNDWQNLDKTSESSLKGFLGKYPYTSRKAEVEALLREITKGQEEAEWASVDQQDVNTLLDFLDKYPDTVHRAEIDNLLWQQVVRSSSQDMASLYLSKFPNGIHVAEAQALTESLKKWAEISGNATIEDMTDYIKNNPTSPFLGMARIKLDELKDQEIERMRTLQSNYPVDDLFYYLDSGIFNDDELINDGVATEESLSILRHLDDVKDSLPDINEEIRKCRKECADGHTDVFLFGIPSTGKTCILMGLIGSSAININTVRAGGPYSCALQQYLEAGFTIGQTPKDFVATIEAEIFDGKNTHELNLVEMAGEDFAFKIADNENGEVSFEDIGAGATDLLCNNNRKVFFLIVDPTAKSVAFNHLVDEVDDEGNVRTYLVRKNVNQKIILKRMVDLLSQPENKNIMKNVDSIHIIVSKADVLGDGEERDKEALRRFMEQHSNIVQPLTHLCQEYGINSATNGTPMLYTFSLGRFYVGGVYQYDETDATKLVNVLKGNTEARRDAGFFGRLRDTFN